MNAIRVETTIETDGELHLTDLPCRRGDRVEAVVLVLRPVTGAADENSRERETTRQEALARLRQLVAKSTFRSTGPYPTRDELYDRD